jgi:hypothetical protein
MRCRDQQKQNGKPKRNHYSQCYPQTASRQAVRSSANLYGSASEISLGGEAKKEERMVFSTGFEPVSPLGNRTFLSYLCFK